MLKRSTFIILIVLIILAALSYAYLSKTYPQTSPVISGMYYLESIFQPHAKLNKHVMGFLPYWRIDDAHFVKPELLSEINYFSLDVGADGKLKTIIDGETDPGYRGWQNQTVKDLQTKANIYGADFTVTIAALDNTVIESVLDSEQTTDLLVNEIIELVKTNNLDGVNIDFEYSGIPDEKYRAAFTKFSSKLKTSLSNEIPEASLSLSVMPLAARSEDLFDFPKLSGSYDRFLGMSYDFYGQNSDVAGPVAPMRGFKDNKYFFDIETMYEDLTSKVPANKVVMGIPYYGWDWAVVDGKVINGTTLGGETSYAAVISYARAREDTNLKPKQCQWDEYAVETWCWYTDSKKIDHQVWLMDNKAIQTRFDYANSQNFGGVGIWVLGYDQGYTDLWNMISKKFTP